MARAHRQTAPVEQGLVVAAYGRRYRVELADASEMDCVTRGRKSDVACGDHVRVAKTGAGGGVIESVEPRASLFFRSDARREKLIAANVTQLIVVVAPIPVYHEDLLDRCLVGAEHARIKALIALNKADLPEASTTASALAPFCELGYPVVMLSAKRDVTPLLDHLKGEVSVLVGQSGMGKSTLINALVPDAAARVAEISAALGSGRHTTTHAEMYRLDDATRLIDSPGLQEFGLHHLSTEDAAHAYVEFRPYLSSCRFRDCRHVSEPNCAVATAAGEGKIAERRLVSYRRLAAELARR